jgi:hypothetical protein
MTQEENQEIIVTVKISRELYSRLKRFAKSQDRNIKQTIRKLLKDTIPKFEQHDKEYKEQP